MLYTALVTHISGRPAATRKLTDAAAVTPEASSADRARDGPQATEDPEGWPEISALPALPAVAGSEAAHRELLREIVLRALI